jgi:hypothetical protein
VVSAALWLFACQIDVTGIPLAKDASPGDDAAAADGSSELPRDASDDADAVAHDASTVRHGSCDHDLPTALPDPPKIATLANGRPEFDSWRDLSCADVEQQPTCADYTDPAPHLCPRCLGAKTDPHLQVCVPFGSRGCIATGHAESCVACVPATVKARACCLDLEADCRPWPFEGSSQPGELCATHADCEAGLLCTSAGEDENRFAVCACPEARTTQPVTVNLCLSERAP